MGNLFHWLFTDPQTACADATAASKVCASVQGASGQQYVEVFHFYAPWLIFCALGLLIPLYYWLEGRKRLVKGNLLLKRNCDRFLYNQLPWLALVGFFLIAGRYAADSSFFAWRFWRYAWAGGGVGIAVYWLYYFVRRYPRELNYYRTHRTLSQYVPKRRSVAKAGSR